MSLQTDLQHAQAQAAETYAKAQAILDEYPDDKLLPQEKNDEVDKWLDECEQWSKKSERLNRALKHDRFLNQPVRTHPMGADADEAKGDDSGEVEVKAAAFDRYLRRKQDELTGEEAKALSTLRDSEGGYAVYEEIGTRMITAINDAVEIRKLADVISTRAASISFPNFEYDQVIKKRGQGEQIVPTKIKDILGKTEFTPHKRADIFTLPVELVEDDSIDLVGRLISQMSVKWSEQEEGLFLVASGNNEPFGTLNAPGLKARPVTGGGATPRPEDVIDLVYDLRKGARRRLVASDPMSGPVYMMHRNFIRAVRKLRDESGGPNTGQLLWQPRLSEGAPESLNGYPLIESEFFPDHTAGGGAGKPLCLFGNWRAGYWIVDRTEFTIQVLTEKYSDSDEVGYKVRKRVDGAPVLLDVWALLNRAA